MVQQYDLPLEELREYKPRPTKQPDFDGFWLKTLEELAAVPVEYRLTPYPSYPARGIKVYEISFSGYNNAHICGYLALPDSPGPHPGLVTYHGYNWGAEGNVHDAANWALHGYATLHMLVRGQQGGSTDNVTASHGHTAGWMSKGILSPEEYYYRAVYMDAVRAVEVLASMEEVDGSRIGVTGGSQGGGLTLAAAALSRIPRVAVADYPYLSDFNRAIDITPQGPYNELNEFFRRYSSPEIESKARTTLTYFDMINLAPRIQCHTLITVGLVDEITPPSTIFAAYNHLECPKEILVFRYFGHEHIPAAVEPKLRTLMTYLQE